MNGKAPFEPDDYSGDIIMTKTAEIQSNGGV
jgi:hypothetical protein